MELPPPLRHAVDQALEHTPAADLARAAEALSQRYRAETRDGRWHVSSDLQAKAYMATRMPATYAAARAALGYLSELRPDFGPRALLDVGSGTGAAVWAAQNCWASLEQATLLEGSEAMRRWGKELSAASLVQTDWKTADLRNPLPALKPHDLVTLAYVLDELEPPVRSALIGQLWNLTADTLLIVEPGTPAGWRRILDARDQLLGLGANLVAPCPHTQTCPLTRLEGEWCHFSRRVARSRIHRLAKGGDVPWEDEKFIYLAVARARVAFPRGRVIAPTKGGSGHLRLRLCAADGSESEQTFSKRNGEAYQAARRLDWGDALD